MERLALCSKILYDRDVIEKNKKIKELEKKLENPNPKPFYNSLKEYEETAEEAFEILKNEIISLYDDHFEYEHMSYLGGITPRHDFRIEDAIYKCILKISHDSEWSRTNAENIRTSLKSVFNSMIEVNIWENFYNSTSQTQLGLFVFETIRQNLDGSFSPGPLLEDIAHFKCKKCEKIVDCVEEDDICIDCEK